MARGEAPGSSGASREMPRKARREILPPSAPARYAASGVKVDGFLILRRRRTSYLVFPLRGRCHGVTDEVEPDNRSAKTAIENSFHHLIRRYTPPSPQGEDLERVRFRRRRELTDERCHASVARYVRQGRTRYAARSAARYTAAFGVRAICRKRRFKG